MLSLETLLTQAKAALHEVSTLAELSALRVSYLGKKGLITEHILRLRDLSPQERPQKGAEINQLKSIVTQLFNEHDAVLAEKMLAAQLASQKIDISLPGRGVKRGRLHPVTMTINAIEAFFATLGFQVATGPEIEDAYHNFDALNVPPHHPARAATDTFWFDQNYLLRTHTSGVQIRTMQQQKPPIKIIAPGKVYRKDSDQTHTPMFHQIEGLYIDKSATFAQLKWVLESFIADFFGQDKEVRFRASYFPFTEPSAEIDIRSKSGEWIEVLGCGMVHENVLKMADIDPMEYRGFAFGLGVERLTMIRYGVTDLRDFFDNNIRFLAQFG